jgi:hypothetical protein
MGRGRGAKSRRKEMREGAAEQHRVVAHMHTPTPHSTAVYRYMRLFKISNTPAQHIVLKARNRGIARNASYHLFDHLSHPFLRIKWNT